MAEPITQTPPKLVMYEMNKSSTERQHVIVVENNMTLPLAEPQAEHAKPKTHRLSQDTFEVRL